MKKHTYLIITIVLSLGLISFTLQSNSDSENPSSSDEHFEIPDNVQQVIDKSCFGCHNSESQSEKGKKKLQWDKLGDLKTYKLVGKLTDIADVVYGADMPPEKFLEKKPEATPTAVEKKILAEWAENTAKQLAE